MTAQDALFALPRHLVLDRVEWRREMLRDYTLSVGARLYGATLAFHRWGAGQVSWAREVAARIMHRAARTISRYNAELREAGWLDVVEEGMPGRQQVFRLTRPAPKPRRRSGKGDSRVTPRSKSPSGPALSFPRTPSGQAHSLASRLLDRTTASPHPQNEPLTT